MHHLSVLPIVWPMLAALVLLFSSESVSLKKRRAFSIASTCILLGLSVALLLEVHAKNTIIYAIGNWQAPFGIVLVADRISTLFVCVTAFLAVGAICYACYKDDTKGSFFHPLFHLQLVGINGSFLTGDLFNLFVFFEVLLIASYVLVIHGTGVEKTKAALHYVILNLTGSGLFLFALGILYGSLGTLNMADMAKKIAIIGQNFDEHALLLIKAGALLLVIVFGLKSALIPLHFWLVPTYTASVSSVSALFAIMSKVGIYALFRISTLFFASKSGPLSAILHPILWTVGLITILVGVIGVLGSRKVKKMICYILIISSGTLAVAIGIGNVESQSAAIYYAIHSTLATAGLFLLSDMIAQQRGHFQDSILAGKRVLQPILLGSLFFMAAIVISGLPPFSGFIAKILILQTTSTLLEHLLLWPLILFSSLAILVMLVRTTSILFWESTGDGVEKGQTHSLHAHPLHTHPLQILGVSWLLAASPLLVIFSSPILNFIHRAFHNSYVTSIERILPASVPI